MQCYSRDVMAEPVRKYAALFEAVAEGRFKPHSIGAWSEWQSDLKTDVGTGGAPLSRS